MMLPNIERILLLKNRDTIQKIITLTRVSSIKLQHHLFRQNTNHPNLIWIIWILLIISTLLQLHHPKPVQSKFLKLFLQQLINKFFFSNKTDYLIYHTDNQEKNNLIKRKKKSFLYLLKCKKFISHYLQNRNSFV